MSTDYGLPDELRSFGSWVYVDSLKMPGGTIERPRGVDR
jgi:hypothetical protein